MAALAMNVEGSTDNAPTQPQVEVFQTFSSRLDKDLSVWSGLMSKDIAAFTRLAESQKVGTIVVPAAETFGSR